MNELEIKYQYENTDLNAALQLLFQELTCLRNFISIRVKNNPVISEWEEEHIIYVRNKYLTCSSYIHILKCFTSINKQMEQTEHSILIIQDKFDGFW